MASPEASSVSQEVSEFLNSIEDDQQREDSYWLVSQMSRITGKPAVLWGGSMVGFDSYHYRYDSGREGDWFMQGFSPRKQNLAVYILPAVEPYQDHLEKLGPHKLGRSCLYLKSLDTIDRVCLLDLLQRAYADMCQKYPSDSAG